MLNISSKQEADRVFFCNHSLRIIALICDSDRTTIIYSCRAAGEEDEYYAASQFEASDCRRCFPCWDEPAIKARFDITLDVDSTKVALSNMVNIFSFSSYTIVPIY